MFLWRTSHFGIVRAGSGFRLALRALGLGVTLLEAPGAHMVIMAIRAATAAPIEMAAYIVRRTVRSQTVRLMTGVVWPHRRVGTVGGVGLERSQSAVLSSMVGCQAK